MQRGGTLENSGEMLGWALRELRLRVTRNKISKSSQMRNKKNLEKKTESLQKYHRSRQVSDSTRDSARDSGDSWRTQGTQRGTQRGTQGNSGGNSGTQGTQGTQTTHFGELSGELKRAPPLGIYVVFYLQYLCRRQTIS